MPSTETKLRGRLQKPSMEKKEAKKIEMRKKERMRHIYRMAKTKVMCRRDGVDSANTV